MKNRGEVNTATISIGTPLLILFIALKLFGVINWSWRWVLCPLWIGIALTVFILLMVLLIVWVAKK